jgi:hypothetical protein
VTLGGWLGKGSGKMKLKTLCSAICLPLSVTFLGMAQASPAPAGGFALENSAAGGHMDVTLDGKTAARYMFGFDTSTPERTEETYKPYLHVFDAAGGKPVTKGPGGQFPHHRGIFLGWNRITVDGRSYDRWHMRDGAQVHREFTETTADADGAVITSRIDWQGRGDEGPVLSEARTMRFSRGPTPTYLMVDIESTVTAVAGDTELGGDPEHAGLQFRPANEVDAKATRYLFPKPAADPHRDLDYDWVGQSFTVGDRTTRVIYLNHPDNPRDTRFSAYRDYGRFGGFFRAKLAKDESLTLRVRFLISEDAMPSAEWIQEQHNAFTGKTLPVPETTEREPG